MKRNQFVMPSVALAALALAGCQPTAMDSTVTPTAVEIGPKYSPRQGLSVPELTRQSLGLKVVEVIEQKVPTTLELTLRLYRTGATNSLASGRVTPEQAKALKVHSAVQVLTRDGHPIPARIASVSDELRKATGMVEVLVDIPNAPEPLRLGEFRQARVTLETGESVVTIPRAALLECSDGHWVYTVSGESFVRAPVKVGAVNGDRVEIKEGLYAGDQVVAQPVMTLWLTELAAVKGGQACCLMPAKGK